MSEKPPMPRTVLFYRDFNRERGDWETYTPVSMSKREDGSLDITILRHGKERETFSSVRHYDRDRDKMNRAGTWAFADES